jgi:antitoxin VapB
MVFERLVKLFRNGRNQAVRNPREFELPGREAIIRKEGERLVIEPCPPKSLRALMRYLLGAHIVSDLVRRPQGRVAGRIREVGEAQACTTMIGRVRT